MSGGCVRKLRFLYSCPTHATRVSFKVGAAIRHSSLICPETANHQSEHSKHNRIKKIVKEMFITIYVYFKIVCLLVQDCLMLEACMIL